MLSLKEEVEQLKKEKNAVILAHYYVPDDVQEVGAVQEIADYVGDSFYLSKIAKNIGADLIVFAGVSFMGESAKILNPKKKVLLPDRYADCAMAHMASVDKVKKMREEVEDLAVVCYINSTAELKAVSDVCVTSSNAVEIVKKLSNKNIFFIPDGNLGAYVASKVPEKNIICNDGYCPIHRKISANLVIETKRAHPNALFLVHPECSEEVTNLADFVGSTSEIIDYATKSVADRFIICTEMGVFFELQQKNPEKKFYSVGHRQFCPNMKKVTLERVEEALEKMQPYVEVPQDVLEAAAKPLKRMLELAAK